QRTSSLPPVVSILPYGRSNHGVFGGPGRRGRQAPLKYRSRSTDTPVWGDAARRRAIDYPAEERVMRNQVKRLSAVAAILLALVAGACSESNPVQPLAPSDESSESLSLADDLRAIASGRPIDRAWHAEQVIGPEGGFIYVDLHHLYVPRGAVSGPTKFTIDLSQ